MVYSPLRRSTLKIITSPSGVEYRVYNDLCLNCASWGWTDLIAVFMFAYWNKYHTLSSQEELRIFALVVVIIIYIYRKSLTILYESITPLPGLGIQLSSTRGLPLPFLRYQLLRSTSHSFIPISDISTIVINQGLRRFKVEYYLAIVLQNGSVIVVYEELRPHFDILSKVYHGTRAIMSEHVKMGDK